MFDIEEKILASQISITNDIHDRNFLEIVTVKGICHQCHVCRKYGGRLEVYDQADR
jgi:hypothetical protein